MIELRPLAGDVEEEEEEADVTLRIFPRTDGSDTVFLFLLLKDEDGILFGLCSKEEERAEELVGMEEEEFAKVESSEREDEHRGRTVDEGCRGEES